jgi:hypothetical protein
MLKDFFHSYKKESLPYLILGMGPTFSERNKFDLTQYATLGINRVVTKIRVNLCQIIDFYIAEKYQEDILRNCDYLVVPYYPHFFCRPFPEVTVEKLIELYPFMRKLSEEDRLLCYNLSTVYPLQVGDSPWVKAKFFSAESAVNLLANLGVKEIRTLGIDGGTIRSEEFSDHGPSDPRGFDLQWEGISRSIGRFNLSYSSLSSTYLPHPKIKEALNVSV